MRLVHVTQRGLALLLATSILGACNTQAPTAQAPRPSPVPTSTAAPLTTITAPDPTPTPAGAWTFPAGSRIAGVDVSGRTPATAIKLVSLGIARWQQPIPLMADEETLGVLKPYQARLDVDVQQLVADAEQLARADKPVDLAWQPSVDEAKLRAELESVAETITQSTASDVLTDTEALTSTFTFRARPGRTLDVDATAELLMPLLVEPTRELSQTVVLSQTAVTRPPMAELERVLQAHLKYWKGVGGIYVHDLETGETLGINEDTVFSGASVMKVPIMIYVYSKLGKLNTQQRKWMENVIINSDNLDANALLAAAAGGKGTEVALGGVNEMSAMLEELGLEHTYQLIPYESGEWLIQNSRLPKGGPKREGAAPYTAPDPYLRTTPREMGELFVMLAQCAEGEGPLLEKYRATLNEKLCDEMMAWLERPHDPERMVAGIPAGVKVAHKGGWIDDMQSDVGIVSSPYGRYVAAIYIWRDGYVTDIHASPSPYLGDFSHTIYTFFNPEPLSETQD